MAKIMDKRNEQRARYDYHRPVKLVLDTHNKTLQIQVGSYLSKEVRLAGGGFSFGLIKPFGMKRSDWSTYKPHIRAFIKNVAYPILESEATDLQGSDDDIDETGVDKVEQLNRYLNSHSLLKTKL